MFTEGSSPGFEDHSAIQKLSSVIDLKYTCGFITLLRTGKPHQNVPRTTTPQGTVIDSPAHMCKPNRLSDKVTRPAWSDSSVFSPLMDPSSHSPRNGIKDSASAEVLASELDSLDKALAAPKETIKPHESANPSRDKLKLDVGDCAMSNDTAMGHSTPSCDQSVECDWVMLDCCYGIPLFHAEVNRQVCDRIASQGLCSRDR